MTTQQNLEFGSTPEQMVYLQLLELGKVPEVDFSYQAAQLGGRMQKGGMILDFLFYDPPDLAINVQGIYWHYGKGTIVRQNDLFIRAQLAGEGTHLIFIDENDIMQDVEYYTREALRYRDHSQLGRG